jgi:hypothetical protein
MSTRWLSRREVLALVLGATLGWGGVGLAWGERRQRRYTAEVGILHSLLTFRLPGTIDEQVDRAAGRYEVTIVGQGNSIDNRLEARGSLVAGRWAPERAVSVFHVAGRESRSETIYDWSRRVVEVHGRAETFLLRRQRAVDDVLTVPVGQHVDDAVSALLNYADGQWPAAEDGRLQTWIVRRRRTAGEGPDEAHGRYGAELVPFVLMLSTDASGQAEARVDMTRFSSWARADRPARLVFGSDRRPVMIDSSLILGTSVTIRFDS